MNTPDFVDEYAELKPFTRCGENNFSHWFPKIKGCGIRVPKSLVFPVPLTGEGALAKHFYLESPNADMKAIQQWLDENVLPVLDAENFSPLLFVKNSVFSNKFDARTCFVDKWQLAWAMANINYESICLEAGGLGELVIRERILYANRMTPCIYNGLPLRPEFRIFYDFTKKKPIFVANYWDWEYVYPHLYEATDKVVFQSQREHLEDCFTKHKDEVLELVTEHMSAVEGLEGPWSVDLMLDESNQWWLIDMAVAEQSAYWELRPGNEAALAEERRQEDERKARWAKGQDSIVVKLIAED